ncbi:DUF695 domain-containing protein [Bradyrhizobium sp. CCH5-F6]|uniref:DUF695 domain-containing protein n=1 Tax=Bradyrhizobium sp. CCH5-F6 TaxID=1768753 RepID=UPI0018D24916|nr:DUF695 domain-containing protein [Bradyrhizobium sp. CCH5-F6]
MSQPIPKELHTLIEFRQRDLPGFATVNSALKTFEMKSAFPWHLSVLVDCVQLVLDRLPSQQEQDLLYEFEDKLDLHVKADGNALFLARVTHDARREIIWRIHDPERANAILLGVLSRKDYPRPFEHRIDDDSAWTKAAWYLDNLPVDR